MSKLKVFFVLALMIAALVVTAFAAETVIYENDFSDPSTISDFVAYRAEWEIRDGALYLTNRNTVTVTNSNDHFSHIIYQHTESLSDYILEIDMLNARTSAGVLFNVQQDLVGTGNSAFYGYTLNLAKLADRFALGNSNSSGGWKGNVDTSEFSEAVLSGINVHIAVIVKGGYVGVNISSLENGRLLYSYKYCIGSNTSADAVWTSGTVGLRAVARYNGRVNAGNLHFDNMKLTTANETSVNTVVNMNSQQIEKKKVHTESLVPVYSNDFTNASLADFKSAYGTWEINGGKLYLKAQDSKDYSRSFLIYDGEESLKTLTDYVVDVDVYNSTPYSGVIIRSDVSRISPTMSGDDFYGYIGYVDFSAEKGVFAVGHADGKGTGGLSGSKNVTVKGTDIHLQLAVKGNMITYNIYDIERDRLMWSTTNYCETWDSGSFGVSLYTENTTGTDYLSGTYFDNLVVSLFGEDKPVETLEGMTFTNPVAPGADPFVFKDDDGTYYLYGSGGDTYGYRVYSSKNLVEWTARGYCLHFADEGVYTDPDSEHQVFKLFWAPEVIKYNGKYYLTFSSTGYKTPDYSVHYATSTSPLASYTRDARNVVLKTVDLEYDDTDNPNLYGSGHHSFVEAPNGKDMLIIYHCHRTNKSWSDPDGDLCSPRSVCVDYAWFEGDWLLAGSAENRTVPTAVPQPILEGTVLERETYYKGEYTALASLPTVYVANTDGLDTNTGEKTSPVATISRATALLPNGGTIVLMQNYNSGSLITLSSGDKPLLITAEHNNVIWEFKCIRINSDVYIDNIIFAPIAANDVAVIECNFNNVIIGEGVSCINRPFGEREFPYLVGGRWKYGGSLSTTSPYRVFNYDATLLSSDSEYTLTVIGGTWEMVEACSVSYRTPIADSTPNAVLERTNINLESWGDVNYDGSVTLADAVLAIKSALDGGFNKRIDFNYDKTVTLLDVMRLLKLI